MDCCENPHKNPPDKNLIQSENTCHCTGLQKPALYCDACTQTDFNGYADACTADAGTQTDIDGSIIKQPTRELTQVSTQTDNAMVDEHCKLCHAASNIIRYSDLVDEADIQTDSD
jgi:hypothetical protein